MSGSIYERDTEVADKTKFHTAVASVSYRLGSNVSLALVYDYSEQDPEDSVTTPDYVVRTVSFFVSYTF